MDRPTRATEAAGGEASADAADAPRRFVWTPHPSLRFGNALRVDFEARFQGDVHRSYEGADTRADLATLELQRRRLGVSGRVFSRVQFEVERELAEQPLTAAEEAEGLTPKTPWKDVFIDLEWSKRVQVRAGRFKIPFGLDQLTSISNNDFLYRSLGAAYLAPSRDTGVAVHGRVLGRSLNYSTGVFRHDGDNGRSKKIQGGDQTYAVRVAGTPLRPFAPRLFAQLEIGGAFTTSVLSDDSFRPNGLRGRTIMTQDTFFAPVYVRGTRRRWEGDADWSLGPASLRAEYTRVLDDRIGQGLRDEDLPSARYQASYVSGTYLLTGERKTRPLEPRSGILGPGAVEIAVRFERMWRDSVGGGDVALANPRAETILPSGDRAFTLGINWYVNRWLKLQANAIRERVEDPGRSPVPSGAAFWSEAFRLQFTL